MSEKDRVVLDWPERGENDYLKITVNFFREVGDESFFLRTCLLCLSERLKH